MNATAHLIESVESYAEYAEVRVPGFRFPIATFSTIEDAEDLIASTDLLAQAVSDHRTWALGAYDSATIAEFNIIPV